MKLSMFSISTDPSLRKTLVIRLCFSLTFIGLIASVVTYFLAYNYASFAYDRALMDSADSVYRQIEYSSGNLKLNLPEAAKTVLLTDHVDEVRYRVIDLRTHHVLGAQGDLGEIPESSGQKERSMFRDITLHHQAFRVVTILEFLGNDQVPVLVEIGETKHKREVLAKEILLGVASLMLVLVVISTTLVWQGIAKTLQPLAKLEEEAAKRSTENLSPLAPEIAPREVRRLIEAINRLMDRLASSIDIRQRFTSNVAHQLRTPIAGLRLQAQLAKKVADNPNLQEMLSDIEENATRAAHIIDQLLMLSKAQADDEKAIPKSLIMCADLAKSAMSKLVNAALEKSIDLGLEVNEDDQIVGNRLLLEEMLGNLLDNAIRYTPAQGRVTLSLSKSEDGTMCFRIIDNGPGIPANQLPQVFNRHYRADTTSDQGAGLGLAIVREIVHHHSAKIQVNSDQGKGCVFEVFVPCATELAKKQH